MKFIILAAWGIWIIKNSKIFNNQIPRFNAWKTIYIQELKMVSYRMKKAC
jgi:hypothetical protein